MTYNEMPDDARVWIYQSNIELSDDESEEINQSADDFIQRWTAHGSLLRAAFDIFYNRFLVFFVDEKQAMASGCSIDKSVKFIQEIEKAYELSLFDRLRVAYKDEKDVKTCTLAEFEKLLMTGKINEDTIVFNNLISTKSEFDKDWEGPVKESWHAKYLQKA